MAESELSQYIDRRKILDLDDEEILKIMEEDWHESTSYFQGQGIFERNRRYEMAYNANDPVPEPTEREKGGVVLNTKGRAKNFYPITTSITDTAIALVLEALFSVEDFFLLLPTQQPDPGIDHLEALHDFLKWDIGPTRTALRDRMEEWITQAFMFDWGIAEIHYEVSGANVMKKTAGHVESAFSKLQESGGGFGPAFLDLLKSVADKIKLNRKNLPAFKEEWDPTAKRQSVMEVLNMQDTRPDPRATDFNDDCRFFCDELTQSWSKILNCRITKDNPYGLYEIKQVDKFLEVLQAGAEPQESQHQANEVQKGVSAPDFGRDLVTLRRWRSQYAEFVSDAGFNRLLRRVPRDGWTLCKLHYKKRQKRWEGYSLIGLIEKLNYEINAIANSRRDNVNFVLDAIAVINRKMWDTQLNSNTKMYPGKVVWVKGDVDKAAAFMRPPDVTQSAAAEIQFGMQMVEKVSHVSENTQAAFRTGGRRTATEAEYVQTGQMANMGPITRHVERHGLRWALSRIIREEELNLTEEVHFQVLGEAGVSRGRMSPEILSRYGPNIDVMPIGSNYGPDRYPEVMKKLEGLKFMYSMPEVRRLMDFSYVGQIVAETVKIRGYTRLFQNDPTLKISNQPEIENYMMVLANQKMMVHDSDDHDRHIQVHEDMMETPEFAAASARAKMLLEAHVSIHQELQQEMEKVRPGPQPQNQLSGIANTADVTRAINPASQGPENMSAEEFGGAPGGGQF